MKLLGFVMLSLVLLCHPAIADTLNVDFKTINNVSYMSGEMNGSGKTYFQIQGVATWGDKMVVFGFPDEQDPVVGPACLRLLEQLTLSRKTVTSPFPLVRVQYEKSGPYNAAKIQYCTSYEN